MLIGEDSAGGGEQPRQRRLRLRQAVDAAPGNSKGLSHGILGVGLAGRSSEGERKDGAMVLLESNLEARDISVGHRRGTNRRRCEFPNVRSSNIAAAQATPRDHGSRGRDRASHPL
jgi:hypothetical protein